MSATSVQDEQTARGSKTSVTFSNTGSQTQEEGEEAVEEEEKPIVPEVEIRTTFFDKKYPKPPTLPQVRCAELKQKPLFSEVLVLDDGDLTSEQRSIDKTDILVTGFGIRNLKSLQDALRQDEERRLRELYKYRHYSEEEEAGTSSTSFKSPSPPSRSTETETERSSIRSDVSAQKIQLQYLLGLEAEAEEEFVEEEKPVSEAEEEFIYSTSKSMRSAQKYLRVHRIFDFFQLIIAHLLGAMPENPVNFILVFLNKCLLYRSGLGRPPLLYEQKHIEQLYILMDRMNTGFIELDQYHRGMSTLGICEYDKNPPVTQDELVTREFFIREALECEIAIFDDLVRRRWIGKKPPSKMISRIQSCTRSTGPYFIPSDLLLKMRRYEVSDVDRFTGEEGE